MIRAAALVLLTVAVATSSAHAQVITDHKATAGMATYVDGLDTVIFSPFARAAATVPGEIELGVEWNADVISSASVDVITAATERIEELRHEIGVSVARDKGPWRTDLRGGYSYSFEHDGDSHILSVGAKRGFRDDNYELSLGYSLTINRVGVATEPASSWRPLNVHAVDVGLTRLLDRRTMAELMYSAYFAKGYQASPYRRVPIEVGGDLRGAIWVDEVVPDFRWRNAITGRVRRVFGDRVFGSFGYRFYADNWGVSAHTQRGIVSWELTDALSVRFQQRIARQSAASFYAEHYFMEPRYRTRDRRLSPHLSGLAGVAVTWEKSLGPTLGRFRLRLGYDAMVWRFAEFAAPDVSITNDAELRPLGWVHGQLIQVGLALQR